MTKAIHRTAVVPASNAQARSMASLQAVANMNSSKAPPHITALSVAPKVCEAPSPQALKPTEAPTFCSASCFCSCFVHAVSCFLHVFLSFLFVQSAFLMVLKHGKVATISEGR